MEDTELKQNRQMLILESLTAHILDTETLVQTYSLQVFVKYFTEY